MEYRLFSWKCPHLDFKVPYNLEKDKFVLFSHNTKYLDQIHNYGIAYSFQTKRTQTLEDTIRENDLISISYEEAVIQIRQLIRFINKAGGIGAINKMAENENNCKYFLKKVKIIFCI
jgi:hypothetical protein